jgi:SSS family solute:Na+ symporter
VFLFGALFHPTEYMAMWWLITESIFVGGAGACIIGGLYWKRGTTAGAWTGMLVGSTLSFGGLLVHQCYGRLMTSVLPHLGLGSWAADVLQKHPEFPLNPREISFFAALLAAGSYALVSWLTCRRPHDMDKLLHRGQYAVEGNVAPPKKRFSLYNIVGITDQFTRGDRWTALGIFAWHSLWVLVLIVGSVLYLLHPWSDTAWADYWIFTSIHLPLVLGVVTTIWFTFGVTRDLRRFFRRLKEERVDAHDDGTVVHGAEDQSSETGELATAQSRG